MEEKLKLWAVPVTSWVSDDNYVEPLVYLVWAKTLEEVPEATKESYTRKNQKVG